MNLRDVARIIELRGICPWCDDGIRHGVCLWQFANQALQDDDPPVTVPRRPDAPATISFSPRHPDGWPCLAVGQHGDEGTHVGGGP